MIVGVSGYGFSGASGVIDLLREYQEVQVVDKQFEFQILKAPDGLIDLYHGIVERNDFLSANTSLIRFKRMVKNNNYFCPNRAQKKLFKKQFESFIESLKVIEWKGKSVFDPQDIRRLNKPGLLSFSIRLINKFLRVFRVKKTLPCRRKRYYSHISNKDFFDAVSFYIESLLKGLGYDLSGTVVLDQFFDAFNPRLLLDAFPNHKIIIVDRDPRDIYLLSNYYYRNATFMPVHCGVEGFVESFLNARANRYSDSTFLFISFEDLVLKQENTIRQIETFLDINKRIRSDMFFKPDKSIANIGLFVDNDKHKKEISYLSKKLDDFCRDYSDEEIKKIRQSRTTNSKIFE